jgi:hypothetical protein
LHLIYNQGRARHERYQPDKATQTQIIPDFPLNSVSFPAMAT